MFKRALTFIETVSDWSGKITAYLIPAMMVVMAYEVVARYIFNKPTIWVMETTQFIFIASTAMGGAWLLLHRGHVNVPILHDRLGTRTRAIVDSVTSLFFFFFIFFLFRYVLAATIEAVANLYRAPTYWEPPVYPIYIIMSAGILLIFLQGVVKFIRDLTMAVTGKAEMGLPEEKIE